MQLVKRHVWYAMCQAARTTGSDDRPWSMLSAEMGCHRSGPGRVWGAVDTVPGDRLWNF